MNRNVYVAMTYVPGTEPWKAYRDIGGWLDSVRGFYLEHYDQPAVLRPYPRDPVVLADVCERCVHLLEGTVAMLDGNQAAASEFLLVEREP